MLALRHQLQVLDRSRSRWVRLAKPDRWLWVCCRKSGLGGARRSSWSNQRWSSPGTAAAFGCFGLEEPSAYRRPTVPTAVRSLIRTMSQKDPSWGAPRIHGELVKLGIDVSQATVAKYMVRHRRPPSQTWRTFLANHIGQVIAAHFFVVPTATCGLLFVPGDPRAQRAAGVHVAVTDHPTAAWTAQRCGGRFLRRCAAICCPGPRSRIHRQGKHGDGDGYPRNPHRPTLTVAEPYVERFIGSERRECLDGVIVFSAPGLQRLMDLYCAYYVRWRTHLSLHKDAPIPRTIAPPSEGRVVALAQVGGLHHRYQRRAA